MENKIPSAEEFLKSRNIHVFDGNEGLHEKNFNVIKNSLVSFAKIHVEAALKAASGKATTKNIWEGNTGSEYCDVVVDKNSILNSYPLKNIK
jgi:hypothetical protein